MTLAATNQPAPQRIFVAAFFLVFHGRVWAIGESPIGDPMPLFIALGIYGLIWAVMLFFRATRLAVLLPLTALVFCMAPLFLVFVGYAEVGPFVFFAVVLAMATPWILGGATAIALFLTVLAANREAGAP